MLFVFLVSCKQEKQKESDYYLTSPWVTEKVDWFLLYLPEKWVDRTYLAKKDKSNFSELLNDVKLYELSLKEFHVVCTYMDVKDNAYENWNLEISGKANMNQVFYNLGCQNFNIEKIESSEDLCEVNISARSDCKSKNFKSRMRGIRYKNHILLTSVYYNAEDKNYEEISKRIIEGINHKYIQIETLNH